MSAPSTPEHGRRPGRQGTSKPSKKADWNFNTWSNGATVWSSLEAESQSRPGTSSGRLGTSSLGRSGTSQGGRAYAFAASKESSQDEKQPKEPPGTGKFKVTKASADLSPYMATTSPYMNKMGSSAHSRPMSRMEPTKPCPRTNSAVAGFFGSPTAGSSRPATPVHPGHAKSQESRDAAPGGQGLRPSTQPAGYGGKQEQTQERPGSREQQGASFQARWTPCSEGLPSTSGLGLSSYLEPSSFVGARQKTAGMGRSSVMASKGMDVAAPFKSDLQTSQESSFKPSARPTTQPHVRYGQHAGIAEVDRDTGHANGKTQASQNSVLSYHRKDLSAPSAVSDAQALNPTQSSQVAQLAKSSLFRPATSGYQHGATRTDDWSHGDVAGQQESTSPSAGGRGTQDESCTANASQTGHAQGGSSQSMETKTDLPLSRLSSTWIADSLPGNGRERMGTPKGGSSHDPVSSRPSSSLRPEPPSYNGMQSLPGGGHRAAAAFAISGLGISPDGRPTTQERHAAQREQLGYGKRPSTQERRQLMSRAGPRSQSEKLMPSDRLGSSTDDLSTKLRSSFSSSADDQVTEPSRLSQAGISSTRALDFGSHSQDYGMPATRSGARPRGAEESHRVPVIAENTDGEAYGMTLSDYMRTMKTETWGAPGRPQSGASATMAVEDCIPPDNASLLSDFSGCSFVDPEEVLSDLEYSNLDREGNAVLSYSSESEDPMPREGVWDLNSNRHTFSQAAENGLDLRPATAAVGQTHTLQHDIKEDKAADTRQVDLASLPASLFYPRSEEDRARRPSGSGRSDNIWHHAPGSGRRSNRTIAGVAPVSKPRGRSDGRPRTRKAQSARPVMDRADFFNDDGDAEDEYEDGEDNGDSDGPDFCIMRPPSRQRPPPEALHLFNAPGTSSSAALKPSLSIMKGSDSKPLGHRPKTSAAPTRPLSGPQLRLKSDGSGLANASKGEVEAVAKLTRPPSRGRGPSQLSAGIRHNAAEDFPELPPKGQGAYDVDILGINSDSEFDG